MLPLTFTQCGLRPLRGVHFSVQVTAAVFLTADFALRLTVLVFLVEAAAGFLLEETVLVLAVVLREGLLAVLLVLLLALAVTVLFFFSDVFFVCVTSDVVLACLEPCAEGRTQIDVKSKAQSVIEIRFIRATGSPRLRQVESYLRVIYKTLGF